MTTPHRKVFGIGLSKTGTSSLNQALAKLGLNSVHNPEFLLRLVKDPSPGLRIDADAAARYDALTDLPAARFFKELDEAFAGSLFVLTTRDPDAWLASARNHFFAIPSGEVTDQLLRDVYGSSAFDPDRYRASFVSHEQAVRDYFADRPADFVVLDIAERDKWGVLTRALGVATPTTPYPFENRASRSPQWLKRVVRTHPRLARIVRRLRGR